MTDQAGESLVARDARTVWHPYTQMLTRPDPLPIVRGEGVYLYTEDGRKLLDGTSSWWVNIHGHSHPRLNEALCAQARRLEHVVFANCTHGPAVELAERLLAVLPRGLARVFYSDNGSTAVEVAMKLACQYWSNCGQPSRQTFITLRHAYHGDTVGAMSASEDSIFTRPFAPMLFDVVRAHAPYCYRCPLGLTRATCAIECLGAGEPRAGGTLGALLTEHGASVAAVMVEPMLQGAGGMIVWPAEYLDGRSSAVRPARRADDCRRGAHGLRPHGPDVCVRPRRRDARHHLSVEGADRRLHAARGDGHDAAGLRRVSQRRPQPDLFPRPLVHGESACLRGRQRQPRVSCRRPTRSPGWDNSSGGSTVDSTGCARCRSSATSACSAASAWSNWWPIARPSRLAGIWTRSVRV